LPDVPGLWPSVDSAFVPAYRCGAAPDFHRIPFSLFQLRKETLGIHLLYLGVHGSATQFVAMLVDFLFAFPGWFVTGDGSVICRVLCLI
jgi:hypothetical protein